MAHNICPFAKAVGTRGRNYVILGHICACDDDKYCPTPGDYKRCATFQNVWKDEQPKGDPPRARG